ncbi:hypothetical protein F5Y09DRAFT_346660 [Xylaria sp. FL1042]|nr:hypothetical protein F5Y09DRAFT_346660 [Xylaria sp. FL1042]
MPLPQEQTAEGTEPFDALSAWKAIEEPYCTRGIYTGESRQNFREKIQQMRSREGFPRLSRRENQIPSRRRASMSPVRKPSPEFSGAPRKARPQTVPARQAPLSQEVLVNEDVLLDRKANEMTKRETLRLGAINPIPSGRRSSLWHSWNPDQQLEVNAIFQQLSVNDGNGKARSNDSR